LSKVNNANALLGIFVESLVLRRRPWCAPSQK